MGEGGIKTKQKPLAFRLQIKDEPWSKWLDIYWDTDYHQTRLNGVMFS